MSDLPVEVWQRITQHGTRLLMLDYDGTLASFQVDRMSARPSVEVLESLRRIASRPSDRLAIVSGRPIAELDVLLASLPAHLVGEHGWEERTPEGLLTTYPLRPLVGHRLELATRAASACGWKPYLERKRCSVVLHMRGLPEPLAQDLDTQATRLWRTFFARDGVELLRSNGGLELRASGRSKGTAAAELMNRRDGALPVYVGDDMTDESAFERVRPSGITIRVGGADCETHAEWRLESPRDVAGFLQAWIARAG